MEACPISHFSHPGRGRIVLDRLPGLFAFCHNGAWAREPEVTAVLGYWRRVGGLKGDQG